MLPETLVWVEKARRMFPKSYFTRIDVRYIELLYHMKKKNFAACVAPGEAYLRGCAALRREKRPTQELGVTVLECMAPGIEENIRVLIADIHRLLGHDSKALAHLEKVSWSVLDAGELPSALETVAQLSQRTDMDGVIREIWQSVRPIERETERRAACRHEFLAFGQTAFAAPAPPETGRPLWKLFLPLRGECVLGDYAAVMDAQTPEEADAALAAVEDLTALPPAVFLHALKTGADFPIPGRPLTAEQADTLAEKLSADEVFLRQTAFFAAKAAKTLPELIWARSLALAALKRE